MQTDQLRHFIDVARLGSMSLAAEKNFMTPQGISKSISALEADLGCKLFNRTRNSVTLTTLGSALLGSAELVVATENRLRSGVARLRAQEESGVQSHLVAVCNPIAFNTSLYFPLAEAARGLYSDTRFSEETNAEVADSLIAAPQQENGNTFLGLFAFHEIMADENEAIGARLKEKGYAYRPFLHTTELAVVSSESPLAAKHSLKRSDILSHPLAIAAHSDMGKAIERLYGEASISVSVTDAVFRQRLAASGEVITFIPGLTLSHGMEPGITAVPLQDPSLIEVGFAALPGVVEGPLVSSLIERIRDYYQERQGSSVVTFVDGDDSAVLLG